MEKNGIALLILGGISSAEVLGCLLHIPLYLSKILLLVNPTFCIFSVFVIKHCIFVCKLLIIWKNCSNFAIKVICGRIPKSTNSVLPWTWGVWGVILLSFGKNNLKGALSYVFTWTYMNETHWVNLVSIGFTLCLHLIESDPS